MRHPFDLPEGVVGFVGNDEADEAVGPGERQAVERMGENDRPLCGFAQLCSQSACAESVGADYLDLRPVAGPEQVDEVEQAQAGEGKGPGGAVAGGDDCSSRARLPVYGWLRAQASGWLGRSQGYTAVPGVMRCSEPSGRWTVRSASGDGGRDWARVNGARAGRGLSRFRFHRECEGVAGCAGQGVGVADQPFGLGFRAGADGGDAF